MQVTCFGEFKNERFMQIEYFSLKLLMFKEAEISHMALQYLGTTLIYDLEKPCGYSKETCCCLTP